MSEKEIISTSEEETLELAARIRRNIEFPLVLCLQGDLGSGKTAFSRGFGKALGITEPISSPTFNIVQEYNIEEGIFYHMDLYRMQGENDALSFGIEDYFYESDAVCIVEWPDRLGRLLPPHTYTLNFSHVDEHTRRILVPEELLKS